jgi:hypothetical protein
MMSELSMGGCEYWSNCLTCPFAECTQDVSMKRQLSLAFTYRVINLYNTGDYTYELLAEILKVPLNIVQQAMKYQYKYKELRRFLQTEKAFYGS